MNKNMREIMDYIEAYWEEHRHGPSYREMADALGKSSTSSLHGTVRVLIDEGYLVSGKAGRSRTVKPKGLRI